MPLLKCKDCGNVVSTEATSCPKCGAPAPKSRVGETLSPEQSAKMTFQERRDFQKAGGRILLSTAQKVGFGLVGIFVLFLITKCNAPQTEDEAKADLAKSASAACRAFIVKNLKDPDSAEFGADPVDNISIEKKPGIWFVQRTFRAKNSFNAKVQSKVSCSMQYANKNFSLIELKNQKN